MIYKLAAYELFAIAVIAMLIDHVGLYFGPGILWLRVFRMFALVWFVPIGYNSGRGAALGLWAGMLILVAMDWHIGLDIFPLSALATIIAIKLVINPLMDYAFRGKSIFWLINLALVMIYPLTERFVEYGTIALMFAMAGWILRHKDQIPANIVNVKAYFMLVSVIYIAAMQVAAKFSPPQFLFVAATTLLMSFLMLNFKQLLLNSVARRSGDPVERICKFIGHKTLEIYVVVYIILKGLYVFAYTHY